MANLPTSQDAFEEYSRFTFDLWRGLDSKYDFYVKKWQRTLDFLRDVHWEALKQYDRDVLPEWKRFPLLNFTLAFYNDFLTDYLKSEVRFSATPASGDPHDIDAAELAEQLMRYLWNRLAFDTVRVDLGAWVIATGCGALRFFWDTDTGEQVPLGIPTPDGGIIPIDPETLQPRAGEPDIVDAGEIGVEVISPQFVRWAANPAHGVMLGLLLSREEAETYYGKDVADRLTYTEQHDGILAGLSQISQPGQPILNDKRTLVIEHYLPRSFRHPEGLWWTAAGDGTTMIHEPWPLPAGRIPVVSFRWIPIPGEPHLGTSPLYGTTFENKTYEEILARILEWYAKAKPKRLLKSGGGVAPGDITDEPFQELVINQGAEPGVLQVDDAPAGLFRMLQLVQNDMTITSGRVFEQGDEIPEGVATMRIRTPGEYKTSKAVTTAHISSKGSWKQVGEILMYYVGNFYNEGRVIAIQGPDRGFLWREFSGSDLLSSKAGLAATIDVQDIPLLPQTRQNLRDTVIALLQSQAGQILFAGPDGKLDMDRIGTALKATGLDVDFDTIDPDVLEARNEQVEFRNLTDQSQAPQIQSWQNHLAHYVEHTKVVKSLRFRSWPELARQAFLQHIAETEQRLNQQAQEEAQAMVTQEQQLRFVREQESLRAKVSEEWAKRLIELVTMTTGMEVEDIMKITGGEIPSKKEGK